MVDEARCEELRDALSAIRAQIEPRDPEFAVIGVLGDVVVRPSMVEREGSSDTNREIRALEQALRDAGCEES